MSTGDTRRDQAAALFARIRPGYTAELENFVERLITRIERQATEINEANDTINLQTVQIKNAANAIRRAINTAEQLQADLNRGKS